MEQQLAAGAGERQVAELVEHDELEPGELGSQGPDLADPGLLLKPVHKYGRRRSTCSSVSQNRSLIPVSLRNLNQIAALTSMGPDPRSIAAEGRLQSSSGISHRSMRDRVTSQASDLQRAHRSPIKKPLALAAPHRNEPALLLGCFDSSAVTSRPNVSANRMMASTTTASHEPGAKSPTKLLSIFKRVTGSSLSKLSEA